MKLEVFLTSRAIPFERLTHRPTFTANRMAQALHLHGKEVAKTVLLRTDRGYVLAVLPATHRIDFEQIRKMLEAEEVTLATEEEMDYLFPDCERGAIPPFGRAYGLPTLMDQSLADDERITFEAQNHEEALRIAFRDYEEAEYPRKGRFAWHI